MDPRQIPKENNLPFLMWIKKESKRLADYVDPMGSPTQSQMLEFWKLHRPIMWANLTKMGIAKELAHVLDEKCQEARRKNMTAGMYVTDAREEAEKDWLILEPEDSEGEGDLQEE